MEVVTWATFHSAQNSGNVWLKIKMEQAILVWSDRNIEDHLWKWATLTGLVILVGQTEMPLSIGQNCCFQYHSRFCILLTMRITKCKVAWVGSLVWQEVERGGGLSYKSDGDAHPKWDQNLQFSLLSKTTSIPGLVCATRMCHSIKRNFWNFKPEFQWNGKHPWIKIPSYLVLL